jgi:hypothetical protein
MIAQMTEFLGNTAQAHEIAVKTETALFGATGSNASSKAYKSQARSILYNVRDSRNNVLRERILSGAVTPETLATATAEQLAAPEAVAARKAAEQRGMQKATLKDDQGAPDFVREKRALLDRTTTAAAQTAATTPSAAPSKKRQKLEEAPPLWRGTIDKSDKSNFGPFGVAGFLIAGQLGPEEMLGDTLEVSGRLDIGKLHDYLRQLSASTSRRKTVMRLEPMAEHDVGHFMAIFGYFVMRQRAGFVKVKGASISTSVPEEIYLLPFGKGDPIPEFLKADESFNKDVLLDGPQPSSLLLVLVTKITTLEAFQKSRGPAPAASAPAQLTASMPAINPEPVVLPPLVQSAVAPMEPATVLPPISVPTEAPAAAVPEVKTEEAPTLESAQP